MASTVAAPDPSSSFKELADVFDGALQRLDSIGKTVVAAVQCADADAGLGMMLNADLIAAEWGTKVRAAYAGDTAPQVQARSIAGRLAAGSGLTFGQGRRLMRGAWDVDHARIGADENVATSQAIATIETMTRIDKFATE